MLLINAIKFGRICQIKYFLKAGINVNLADKNGHTPAIHCCFLKDEEKRMKIFKFLLDEDVDVNKTDRGGRSLLSWISFLGRADMMTFLVDNCPHRQFDLDIVDEKGNSLLMLAALSKSLRMVALLLDVLKKYGLGEQVNCFNNEGTCPLMIAFQRNDHECAKLLVKEGKTSISRVLQHIQHHPTTKNCYDENVHLAARGQACYTFMTIAKCDPKNKLPTEQELLEFIFSDGTDSRKETEKISKARVRSAYGLRNNFNFETKRVLERRPFMSCGAIVEDPRDCSRPSSFATFSMETNTSRPKRTFSPSFTGLYEMYSTQLSNSYRKGIPTHEPTPPTPPSVPDIQSRHKESDTRQRRISLQPHSSNLSEKSNKAFPMSKRSSNLTSRNHPLIVS